MRPRSRRLPTEARRSVVVNLRFRLGAGQAVRLKDGSVSCILARSDRRVTPRLSRLGWSIWQLDQIGPVLKAFVVFGVGWALATRKWNAPFGFGPAIAAGALLVVLLPGRLFFPY